MCRIHPLAAAFCVSAFVTVSSFAQTAPATPAAAPVAAPEVKPAAPKLTPEEIVAERDKFLKEIRAQITGHEKEPAETVFKDIKTLKGVSAGTLLAIMNIGYSRSLGVSCTHCHTPGEWDKSDKPQKEIAREMGRMSKTINSELLPKIANLQSQKPGINCTTCHRGELKPAHDLPAPPPRPSAGAAKT